MVDAFVETGSDGSDGSDRSDGGGRVGQVGQGRWVGRVDGSDRSMGRLRGGWRRGKSITGISEDYYRY